MPAIRHANHSRRGGFTLVEALVSLSIVSIAGTALLLNVTSSTQTTDAATRQFMANGMAQQLMDQIAGQYYTDPGTSPTTTTLGPLSSDLVGPGWSAFNSINDFNGLSVTPPTDRWSIPLGTDNGDGNVRHPAMQMIGGYFSRWSLQVSVFYVTDTAPTTPLPAGTTSNYRAVQVQAFYNDPVLGQQQLANLTRVFAYVPGN
jgi:prepilin-type N-terminal cleavage/methylation domain-containing protein